jgi:hypothetical protein
MPGENGTYSESEYQVRVSLRERSDRNIVIFRIDTRSGREGWRTIFLDRATAPVDAEIWGTWSQAVDDIMCNALLRRYGIAVRLFSDEGVEVIVKQEDE